MHILFYGLLVLASMAAVAFGAFTIVSTSPDLEARYEAWIASGSTDAITMKNGAVFITSTGVNAMTLAAPVAGADDGKRLTFIDTGGHAHTITTPTNGINGADHVATFQGAVGGQITLHAYNGVWYQPLVAAVLS